MMTDHQRQNIRRMLDAPLKGAGWPATIPYFKPSYEITPDGADFVLRNVTHGREVERNCSRAALVYRLDMLRVVQSSTPSKAMRAWKDRQANKASSVVTLAKPKASRPTYAAAVQWIAANDDTEWLSDAAPILSVTAALVADLFEKDGETITRDLKRAVAKLRKEAA